MTSARRVVQVAGLVKDFPSHPGALNGIDLSVGSGEAVAIVGPNGSGKTTLLKIILSLTRPTSGRVELFGAEVGAGFHPGLARVGALLEGRANVYERLSAHENCRYYCEVRGSRFDPALFARLCGDLGFGDVSKPVRRLSTGNRQRVALVVALIHRPELIILDEPTIGLDEAGVQALQTLLRDLQRQDGAAVLAISHDAGFVRAAAERIVGLCEGSLSFDRPVADPDINGSQFRLAVDYLDGQARELAGQQPDAPTFAQQLRKLQDLAELHPDISGARIYQDPVPSRDAEANA